MTEHPSYVYFVIEDKGPFVKIGRVVSGCLYSRLGALQVGSPRELTFLGIIATSRGFVEAEEAAFHEKYVEHHVRGEWFELPVDEIERLEIEYAGGIPVTIPTRWCYTGIHSRCLLSDTGGAPRYSRGAGGLRAIGGGVLVSSSYGGEAARYRGGA